MSWTFLSRFAVKPEHDADFAALIPQMEAIAAEEPGTLAYTFYRRSEPHSFAVFESFVDEACGYWISGCYCCNRILICLEMM